MEKTEAGRNLTNVFLAVLTTLATVAALKASYAVTMPLAFALFIIILAWPLQKWFASRLPQKLAPIAALLCLLLVFGVFCGLLAYSGKVIGEAAPRYAEAARELWQTARERGEAYQLSLPENPRELLQGSGEAGSKRRVLGQLFSTVGLWLLVFGLVALGLHEAPKFRDRLQGMAKSDEGDRRLLSIMEQVIDKCGRYFWTRTVVSGIQGVCSGGAALALGLDLAFIWGLTAALLNYIPTVGSLLSVLPPALFALFQFQDVGRAALVFGVMCAIQLVLGVFVDPLLEGRQLQISAFLVLFSIAFWGWVWGIAGALIGVPLTVTVLIFFSHLPGTKWIADLFSESE